MEELTTRAGQPFDREMLYSLVRRRLFYTESFEIYRTRKGAAKDDKFESRGLFDYGPPGCALQANIVDAWRKHFVIAEDMLEVDTTMITPAAVFKTSGHVDRFTDWMCWDPAKKEYLRADHLVEKVLQGRLKGDKAVTKKKAEGKDAEEYEKILAMIDDYDGDALADMIKRLDIRNPDGNGVVDRPIQFNLMFKSNIGPTGQALMYLRPETAQGQFMNFKKLLEFNQNTMPFASASIGKSFRNEISPRNALLRVREFLMAEVEHYVDPESGKKHPRFDEIKDVEISLLDAKTQLSGKTTRRSMKIGDAVQQKIIDNETLGYFVARIKLFLEKIGIDLQKVRFRQHLSNEMAHYACDCWDAEILTSYGWIECVGCADRSAYDLSVHSKATGEALLVKEAREEPITVEEWVVELNKKKLGPKFRADAKPVGEAVDNLSQKDAESFAAALEKDGKITIPVSGLSGGKTEVELEKDLISIKKESRVSHMREYIPNVIEPSFGIGRILYALLEHSYWHREQDVARGVLSLPLVIAPTKVLLVPLSSNTEFIAPVRRIQQRLRNLGIANKTDDSTASIGKRYARNDELGSPLGITVDFDTVKDGSITLRERDSTKQVRASEDDIINAVKSMLDSQETWEQVSKRLPEFLGQSGD